MQNGLLGIFSKMGQKALEKSRDYYSPHLVSAMAYAEELSDEEFAVMLKAIDCFSAQFSAAHSKPIKID